MSILVRVVRAAQMARAIQNESFFTPNDVWLYNSIIDGKTCPACQLFEGNPEIYGDQLKALFPYLVIMSLDEIMPNVHPNCRCFLQRVK